MSRRSIPFVGSIGWIVFIALSLESAHCQDWTQFRGPNGNATVTTTKTATAITAANTAWKTELPGVGWSSPVVSAGRIWLTTAETTKATAEQIAKKTKGVQFARIKTVAGSVKLRALCIDAQTGSVLHNILLKEVTDPDLINPLNSYASPTPAIVGDRVICHFGSYGTWCLDAKSGKQLWQNAIVVDHSVGPGSSPVVVAGTVILVCDGIDAQFVAGLSLETGAQTWRTSRPTMRTNNGEYKKAYSTPLIIRVGNQTQAVIPGAQWLCAYDPASGKELWRADCGDGFSTTPMAVYDSGIIVCSTGYMSADLVAIKPGGSGDVSAEILWRARRAGSTMPTAVAHQGHIYSISDSGILTILETTSGSIKDRVRIGGKFASSPLLAANKLYLGSREGEFSVFELATGGAKPAQLAKTQLEGSIMASPAVMGADLIIRTSESLMRISAD